MICEAIINIAKDKLFDIDVEIEQRKLMEFIKNTLVGEIAFRDSRT